MTLIPRILIGLIALLHLYIAWFEMFAWTTRGPIVFSELPVDLFEATTALAANQGIYNAFLVVGLVWSLLIKDKIWQCRIAVCFLLFVAVAGIVGATTISIKILMLQTVPACLATVLVLQSKRSRN